MLAFNRIKLIVFDLDGTLVDSVADLEWCANEMLNRLGMAMLPAGAARSYVGNGVERFVKRALSGEMSAEPDIQLFDRGLELFCGLYAVHNSERSQPYPGVLECLQRLSRLKLKLACVTNKAERFTLGLVDAMGFGEYFELLVCGDTTSRKKPDPMPLQYAADHFGLQSQQCLMVGDSSNDVTAARAANFAIVCVPYGYNHGDDIADSDPDLVIDNLTGLAELFEQEEARCN